MTVEQAFDQSAHHYDRWIELALPCYGDVFSISRSLIPFAPEAPIRVLDLGAGSGLFSKHVLENFPRATFVLYDLAPKMLALAEERFRDRREQFEIIVGDYREISYDRAFEVAISSLSIHHLTDEDKAALFRRVHAALKPGGVFVNIDQIRGETENIRQFYWDRWLTHVRQQGAAEEQIQESIHRRKTYDRDATLADQLRWLREAGFSHVDCIYKHTFIGVLFAMRDARSAQKVGTTEEVR